MHKTMLVFSDAELLKELQNVQIWGESSEFEISAVVSDAEEAYKELHRSGYDLVICQTQLGNISGTELLRRIKRERLCSNVALCSKEPNFVCAREGIIYGAFDYFVSPIEEKSLDEAFTRIKRCANELKNIEAYRSEEIIRMFEKRDSGIYGYISDMIGELYATATDTAAAENTLSGIYRRVTEEIFRRNEWLDLYRSAQQFCATSFDMGDSVKESFETKIGELFEEYCSLFPNVNNEKIEEVILHILNNPESDLKQKTIAGEHYINSSYLSTVFSAQTGMRFVDYLTTVKLKRAAWLLLNSTMKVTEIASRLDYKDMGYFSRVFKRQYGVTPTEYRIPDDYTYQI